MFLSLSLPPSLSPSLSSSLSPSLPQGEITNDANTLFELAACAMQAQFGEFRGSDIQCTYAYTYVRMWPDLGKPNIIANFTEIEILLDLASQWYLSYEFTKHVHVQLHHQWAMAICNTTINIANIEEIFFKCEHTHNSFRRSGHVRMHLHVYAL